LRAAAIALAAVVLVAGCSSSTPPAPRTDAGPGWPMYRGDLARDGHPAGAVLTADQATRLNLVWTGHLDGAVDGTPVVVGNTVIAASEKGSIAAFDLGSGATVWSRSGLGAFSGSPAVAGGVVVAATLTGHAYAFDLRDGRSMWDWRATGNKPAIWSSPAIYGGLVLLGIGSQYADQPLEAGGVAALDLATGAQVWRFCIESGCVPGGGVWSSVAVDASGRAFVGTGNPDDGVYSFAAATGEKLWAASLHADSGQDIDVGATPIVASVGGREVVAVGSDGGLFAMLDAATKDVIWSRFLVAGSAVHGLIASPAYDGAAFYVPSASPPTGMFALDSATGAIQWERVTDPVYSAPALGKGVLVFGTGDVFGDPHRGGLIALSTTDGAVLWRFDTRQSVFSAPALAGTTVVVGDSGGSVLAFRPA
jgi:outer membrane protein assembly factor BamB